MKQIMKKLLITLMTGVMLTGLTAIGSFASGTEDVSISCEDYRGYNKSGQNYGNWSSPIESHLVETEDRELMRFQSGVIGRYYLVEYYDSEYNYLRTRYIEQELPRYGGFYATDEYYYVLSGQGNSEESAEVECFRLTKYDHNWERLSSVGLYDCNTVYPFEAASARFAVYGQYLYIRTGHLMYTYSDGLNHQANLTFVVDTENMVITDSEYAISGNAYGYVSHSFNQFVQIDGDRLVAVDHGDAYPRAIVLMQYPPDVTTGKLFPYGSSCKNTNILTFPGEIGDNFTSGSVGGFEISSTSYLVAYDNVDNHQNNIYIASMDKNTSELTTTQITFYTEDDEEFVSTPHLVKLSDDAFVLIWEYEDDDYNSSVCYTKLDKYGKQVGKIYTIQDANLSDCQPIVYENQLVWYVCEYDYENDNFPYTFYEIDLADLTKTNQKTMLHGFDSEWASNSSGHWHECAVCGNKKDEAAHIFDNACDTSCNTCGYMRTITHSYQTKWSTDSKRHWYKCSVCGVKKDEAAHIYDNACDETCNICGYSRTAPHSYQSAWLKDESKHWQACVLCEKAKNSESHNFDNACDESCNTCAYNRTTTHAYQSQWSVDEETHWHQCSVCGEIIDQASHTFDNSCDAICDVCSYNRTPSHANQETWTTDETAHWQVCSICGEINQKSDHVFDNECDVECNICALTRAGGHSYQAKWSEEGDVHWTECAVCGQTTEQTAHIFDFECDETCSGCDYIRLIEHSYNENWSVDEETHWIECAVCGATKEKTAHIFDDVTLICTVCTAAQHQHDFGEIWQSNDSRHWKACDCGEITDEGEHILNDGEITQTPTVETEGVMTFTCTVCGQAKHEAIAKLDQPAVTTTRSESATSLLTESTHPIDADHGQNSNTDDDFDQPADLAVKGIIGILGISLAAMVIIVIIVLTKKKKAKGNE